MDHALLVPFPELQGVVAPWLDSVGVVYLAAEPAKPFVDLTRALWQRFPDWPPYEGAHPTIRSHLTVAWGAKLEEAEAAVTTALPLRGRVRAAELLRRDAPERWERLANFPFREG